MSKSGVGILAADVLLWQDYKYQKKTLAWEDLLSVLVGERVEVRTHGGKNISFKNTAPMFYTSARAWSVHTFDPEESAELTLAMNERFTLHRWTRPLPMNERREDFPSCGACFARFVLENEAAWQAEQRAAEDREAQVG